MHSTNALIKCMQKNGKNRNDKEQIPSTYMSDLLKTYGNWKKKLPRAKCKTKKTNIFRYNITAIKSLQSASYETRVKK